MADDTWRPGPYTLGKLGRDALAHLPDLTQWGPHLRPPRDAGLAWSTRLAAQLRTAKLLGCPVCLKLFPPLGARAGLDDAQVRAVLAGDYSTLPPEAAGAAAWVDAVIRAEGASPPEMPEAALVLRADQREHLRAMCRLEIVIHSIGLMFLPHGMIERASQG